MFKYISLDIETTGLDKEKNQILEVGAIIDHRPVQVQMLRELPKFRAVLMHDEIITNIYCANLHKKLFEEILWANRNFGNEISEYGFIHRQYSDDHPMTWYVKPEELCKKFSEWLTKINIEWSSKGVNVAGKNVGTFDVPFLKALPSWNKNIKFNRRYLDPTILCYEPGDEQLPELQKCLDRCDFTKKVSHTALDDAMDIIKVLRYKWNNV